MRKEARRVQDTETDCDRVKTYKDLARLPRIGEVCLDKFNNGVAIEPSNIIRITENRGEYCPLLQTNAGECADCHLFESGCPTCRAAEFLF